MSGGIDRPAVDRAQAESPVAGGEWRVYILECADGSLYTGIARDLERRLAQHNGHIAGGARYTRGRRPVQLRWWAAAPDHSLALRREAAIKGLSRAGKLALIDGLASSA